MEQGTKKDEAREPGGGGEKGIEKDMGGGGILELAREGTPSEIWKSQDQKANSGWTM